jgi:diguanylate cyclase (GGDEF)-like protein
MFHLIDQIATLTDQRDRVALDMALVHVLTELLRPVSLTLYMVVNDANDQRWLPQIMLRRGHAPEVNDPLHADFRLLERIENDTPRQRCLEVNLPVVVEQAEGLAGDCLTCLPLFAGGHDIGEKGAIEIRSVVRLDPMALASIERVLRIYRNMHSMFMYSERDALTGLLNRKSFEETFYRSLREDPVPSADPESPREVGSPPRRRVRLGEQFWLAMVDVDHFKQVNDQFGHQIGDEVLILVGRILKNTFRGYDRVYRFGGEEFVVLLRCPDAAAAMLTVERFRQKMEQYRFPQVGSITVSVGLSSISAADAPDVVCNRADQAVYYAKRHGRNRVCSYDDLVQQGLLHEDVRDGGVELF